MTAVEWLMEQITYDNGFGQRHNSYIDSFDLKEFFEQAKEMEKRQIIDACNQNEFEDIDGMGIHETITKGEEYYNETFNK